MQIYAKLNCSVSNGCRFVCVTCYCTTQSFCGHMRCRDYDNRFLSP